MAVQRWIRIHALVLALLVCAASGPAAARSYLAAELNTREYAALDRAKTVVILPAAILEEHGPYLPAYTDGYAAQRLAHDVADAVVGHGWNVLMFPPIPLGSGGANELAAKYPFPGTFTVRLDTLRSIYMDLADEIGEAGFRYVLIVNGHGAPNHNRALDQACAYFDDTWGGRMAKLPRGWPPPGEDPTAALSEQARREDNASGHGGIIETSVMLFLAPDLVDPAYKSAPAFTVGSGGMPAVAKRGDWPGYFGAPRYSSAELGAKLYQRDARQYIQDALAVLDGTAPRVTPAAAPARDIDDAAIARDGAAEKRQRDWLRKKGFR